MWFYVQKIKKILIVDNAVWEIKEKKRKTDEMSKRGGLREGGEGLREGGKGL